MFRLGLLATLSATILTGCVSTYGYQADQGGDYYYAEPSLNDYDPYGGPYSSIGYGYPSGWYGSFGYGFGYGYNRHSRYGFPYGNYGGHYGYPYSYYPYPHRRPPNHRPPHRPRPPGTPPPDVIVDPPHGGTGGPRLGDRDGGPWRHLERRRPPVATPQPGIPVSVMPGSPPSQGAVSGRERPRGRIMVPQPGVSVGPGQPRVQTQPQIRRAPVSMPQPASQPPPRRESPRAEPAPQRRIEVRERESRRDPTP